jgi:hypothetical protein
MSVLNHKAIITSLDIPLIRPKDYKKQVRKFSENNWQKFLDLLLKENWEAFYTEVDIDVKSEYFVGKLVEYFNLALPVHTVVVKANQINKANLSAPTRQLRNRLLHINNEIKSTLCDFEKLRLQKERANLRKQVANFQQI